MSTMFGNVSHYSDIDKHYIANAHDCKEKVHISCTCGGVNGTHLRYQGGTNCDVDAVTRTPVLVDYSRYTKYGIYGTFKDYRNAMVYSGMSILGKDRYDICEECIEWRWNDKRSMYVAGFTHSMCSKCNERVQKRVLDRKTRRRERLHAQEEGAGEKC